jgi:hypothetical protein
MIETMSFDDFHTRILNLQLTSLQAKIYRALSDATVLYDSARVRIYDLIALRASWIESKVSPT